MSALPSTESPVRIYYSPDVNAYFFKYSHAKRYSENVEDVTTKFRYWADPRPLLPSDLDLLRRASNLPVDVREKLINIVKRCTTIVNANNDNVLDLVLEFMCNGEVLCAVNYDMFTGQFILVPGKLGAALLLREDCCNIAVTDEHVSRIFEVRERADTNLYIAVTPDGRVCGSGIKRGRKITFVRKWIPEYIDKTLTALSRRKLTYRELYELNRDYIEERRTKVRKVVEYFERKHGRKGVLSFSGGKDSLLALHLLVEAGTNADILHVSIEHGDPPQLTDYVQYIGAKLGVKIEILEARWNFTERLLRELGMPTRGNRWCTPLLKFVNMLRYIKSRYGLHSIVSYVGSRKSETLKRSIRPATYLDAEAGLLTHAVCYKFPKLLEFLYLWYYAKLPLFRDYMLGMERVSCVICPFKSCYELKLGEQHYPEQFNIWRPYIEKVLKAMIRDERYLEEAYRIHLWRFYLLHSETMSIAKIAHIPVRKPREIQRRACWLLEHTNVERREEGTYRVQLSIPVRYWRPLDLTSHLRHLLNTNVVVEYLSENRIKITVADYVQVEISSSGSVDVASRDLEVLVDIVKLCYMTLSCVECEHCIYNCPRDAIKLPYTIDTSRCNRCGRCLDACVPCRYLVDMLLYSELTSIHRAKERMEKIREKYKELLLQMKQLSDIEWLKG